MVKKLFAFICLPLFALFLSGCSLKKTPAALQINTTPPANVFVDGKLLGKTPYQGNNWKAGEISLKLIPESTSMPLTSWEGKIKLNSGVLTLVERDFAPSESESSGQILTLEKIKEKKAASLSVISNPDGALVHLDGEAKGFAPLLLDQAGVGDHQIAIAKEGYLEKTIRAKTIAGFKLIANVKLAQKMEFTPTPASASATPTPTAKPGKPTKAPISPTGSVIPQPTGSLSGGEEVLIKDTPTGWLRVRSQAPSGAEVARVKPGEKYSVSEEKTVSGTVWYKIEYEPGKEGWISSQYASLI